MYIVINIETTLDNDFISYIIFKLIKKLLVYMIRYYIFKIYLRITID